MVLIYRPAGREAADHGDQGEIPDWREVAIYSFKASRRLTYLQLITRLDTNMKEIVNKFKIVIKIYL